MAMDTPRSDNALSTRQFSSSRLEAVRQRLSALNLPDDATVAVCGSYGRLEASEHSDFDYFVLTGSPKSRSVDLRAV